MSFRHPEWLWLSLALLPLYGLVCLAFMRRLKRFVGMTVPCADDLRLEARVRSYMGRRALACLSGGFSLLFCLVVPAGPAWGVRYLSEQVQGYQLDFLLDVSVSMLLPDGETSRLERADALVDQMSAYFPDSVYSLHVFKGESLELVPPTAVRQALLDSLRWAVPESLSAPGSRLETGLRALAQEKASGQEHILVILTDGHVQRIPDPALARDLTEKYRRILVFGLGGTTALPLLDTDGQPMRDAEGKVALSAQDELLLRDLAHELGAAYHNASAASAGDLHGLAQEAAAWLRSVLPASGSVQVRSGSIDRSLVFMALAMLFLGLTVWLGRSWQS